MVRSTRPNILDLPIDEVRRLGIVLSILPPYTGHNYAVHQVMVGWTDLVRGWHVTIEPDHRIHEVSDREQEDPS